MRVLVSMREKQSKFVRMVGELILWAFQNNYELTFGEAQRSVEQARLNELDGSGISNSLHLKRLAIDLNLFIDGVYITHSEGYRPLGDVWKSMGGSWGGDFGDGNHFSLEHGGVR